MKIDEIAHTNTFGINLETFSNLTVSDIKRTSKLIYSPELVNETIEYYSLYKRVNVNYIEYFLCNETEVICVVGASVQNTKSNSYIQIHGVYINPEYKHRNITKKDSIDRYCISFDIEVNKKVCPKCQYTKLSEMRYEI